MPFAGDAELELVYKPIPGFDHGGLIAGVWRARTPARKGYIDVAVLLHGGAFTMGDYQDVPVTDVEKLTGAGFTVVSAQYRLAPHALFVDVIDDMVDCFRWIHEGLPSAISVETGTVRLLVCGWSAGATAACYMGHYGPKRTGLPSPAAMIVTYGSFQHEKLHRQAPSEILAGLSEKDRAFAMQIYDEPPKAGVRHPTAPNNGPAPQIPLASTPRLAWLLPQIRGGGLQAFLSGCEEPPFPKATSPVALVDQKFPPTFVVVAQQDKLIQPQQSRDFHQLLLDNGIRSGIAEANMAHGKAENWDEGDGAYAEYWRVAIEPALNWGISECHRQ